MIYLCLSLYILGMFMALGAYREATEGDKDVEIPLFVFVILWPLMVVAVIFIGFCVIDIGRAKK